MSELPVKAEPRRPPAHIPFSQRASLSGDLRISWRALVGALKQLARSISTRGLR